MESETSVIAQTHSLVGPSSLERIDKCPGSLRLNEMLRGMGYVEKPSEVAKKGSRIHALAAELIQNPTAEPSSDDLSELNCAEEIADFANRELAKIDGLDVNSDVYVEVHLEYSEMPGAEPIFWGTSDLIALDRANKCVHVFDWKTGMKAVTEAENNLQGAAYALAAMQKYGMTSAHVVFFNPVIHQLTEAWFDDAQGIADEILSVIDVAKQPNAPCIPGPHCVYCDAREAGICTAYLATCESSSAVAVSKGFLPIDKWDDATVVEWYEKLKNAVRFKEELDAEMLKRIQQNGECGDYVVKESSGGRETREILSVLDAVSDVMDEQEFLGCCTLSVAKCETLFASKAKEKGMVKSAKDGKALFKERTINFVTEKPPRKCIEIAKS